MDTYACMKALNGSIYMVKRLLFLLSFLFSVMALE